MCRSSAELASCSFMGISVTMFIIFPPLHAVHAGVRFIGCQRAANINEQAGWKANKCFMCRTFDSIARVYTAECIPAMGRGVSWSYVDECTPLVALGGKAERGV